MWTKLAHIILKFRLPLMIVLGAITAFMAYKAMTGVKMSYKFAKVVPKNDPDMKYFQKFKKTFGEDGNILAIAFKDPKLFELEYFRKYDALCKEIDKIPGTTSVVALPLLKKMKAEHGERRFVTEKMMSKFPETQVELDSMLSSVDNVGFYRNQIYFKDSNATVMLITLDPAYFNSNRRGPMVNGITDAADRFYEDTDIYPHYAGLPYVRTVITEKVSKELGFLLMMALGILAIILLIFFRSIYTVIFPVLVIGMSVTWGFGLLAIFNYEITLLSALIPPIVVVIGIPNCVYLVNKYHQEYHKSKNKIAALSRMIRKIGIVTLITNLTTAVGFLVLAFNDIDILQEFGMVAGINILGTFVITIIFIPAVFSYLPAPSSKQLKHLDLKVLKKILAWLDHIVHKKRAWIYGISIVLIIVSAWGTWLIYTISYMVDDIPETSRVSQDLRFFEKNFKGIMPLEIVVQTKKRNPKDTLADGTLKPVAEDTMAYAKLRAAMDDTNRFLDDPQGFRKLKNLVRIKELEDYLASNNNLTTPISVLTFIKAARQAYWAGNYEFYDLPTNQDKNKILRYLKNSDADSSGLMNSFIDTTGQVRISMKMADMGSKQMDTLIRFNIRPVADSIFANQAAIANGDKPVYLDMEVTGSTPLFIKGNKFLIANLRYSLVIAFFVISLVMATLFGSFRMIILSLIPNIMPLVITGAVMGYVGIPLKPSTALIFTISFGIAVDDTIHFLAKYRQELFSTNFDISKAVSLSLRETGASMIYTSIILFAGFIIFSISDFDGTVMLGILTSTTLLIAMITNLIVLPSLLITFDRAKRRAEKRNLLIDQYSDEDDSEDEEELPVNGASASKKEKESEI